MKRESLIFFLGFVTILLPFLGVPSTWKRLLSVILGVTFVIVGYQLRRRAYLRSIEDTTGERKTDVYAEHVTPVVAVASMPSPSPIPVVEEVVSVVDGKDIATKARRTRVKKV